MGDTANGGRETSEVKRGLGLRPRHEMAATKPVRWGAGRNPGRRRSLCRLEDGAADVTRPLLLALALALAGCATAPAPEHAALEAATNAAVARHPGALRDAPPEARALVDDLLCTVYAWADVAEAYGCGEGE
jgi:hypothetical protein